MGLGVLAAAVPGVGQELPAAVGAAVGPVEGRAGAALQACERADWPAVALALGDASAAVRQAAVQCWDPALGGLDPLLPLLHDHDASVRRTATERLGGQADPRAHEALLGQLADADAGVRVAAVRALGASPLGDADVAGLVPLLDDPDPMVSTAAAQVLSAAPPDALPPDAHTRLQPHLPLAGLLGSSPESAWAVADLAQRQNRLVADLRQRPADPAGCRDSALATLDGPDAPLAQLLARGAKTGLGLTQVSEAASSLEAQARLYQTCLGAAPLTFSAGGDTVLDTTPSLIGEVDSLWHIHFGLLRADLDRPPEGGELWTRTDLGLEALWPARLNGFLGEPGMPTLDLSARLRRDQLFRYDSLSGWAGGGYLSGRLPFPCGQFDFCEAGGSLLAEHTNGDDGDYLERLVTAQDRYVGDLWLRVPLGSATGTLSVEGNRTDYQRDSLDPANLNVGRVQLDLDSAFQVRVGASRNLYDHSGGIDPTPELANVVRDGWILDSLLGVRFGSADTTDALHLSILGGLAIPLLEDARLQLDPQILFESTLSTQDGTIDGNLSRLLITGRRRLLASPRDFALERLTQSLIEYVYQGVVPGESGVRVRVSLGYDLVQHDLPVSSLDELDTHIIEGGFDVRALVERWIGFGVSDMVGAVGVGKQDFQVVNRFALTLFVPVGPYPFGLDEERPW